MNRKKYISPQTLMLLGAVSALTQASNHIIGNRDDVTPSTQETDVVRGKINRDVWADDEEDHLDDY